jgi:ABC-type amino acid transport system permease subunit
MAVGGVTSITSGVRHTPNISFAKDGFPLRLLRFRHFISSSLSFISLTLTCLVIQGFSLSVHYPLLSKKAAQGGLTTAPDKPLLMSLFFFHHL